MNFLGLYCAKEISSVHLHQVPSIDSVKLLHGNKLKLKTLALKKNPVGGTCKIKKKKLNS